MTGIARLLTGSVSVATYAGDGMNGPTFGSPATVACFVNDGRKLVRNSAGEEVVSETTLYAALADYSKFLVGSKVTVNGRTAYVLAAYKRDSAGPANIHHAHIELT